MKTKITTAAIIAEINENGGLDIAYCRCAAHKDNVSVQQYIVGTIKASYCCSAYIARKVANYFA